MTKDSLPRGLSLGNLNIRDGQGYGLAQAIQEVQIGGFDLSILTDINIYENAYCRNRLG